MDTDTDTGAAQPDARERVSRLAAYAVVRRGPSVLLVRGSERSDAAGQWFLPGGGVEWGEDPADTVVRELHEETGLHGVVTGLLAVLTDVAELRNGAVRLHTVRIIYAVDAAEGELVAEVDGTTDLPQWVDAHAAQELPIRPAVRRLLAPT